MLKTATTVARLLALARNDQLLIEQKCRSLVKAWRPAVHHLHVPSLAVERKPIKVTKHITLHPLRDNQGQLDGTPVASSKRKLVVLLIWLGAKESHLDKYRNFYFERGFEVLSVRVWSKEVLLPGSGANAIASQVVHHLLAKEALYTDMMVHGFSVGGYMYGQMLRAIEACPEADQARLRSKVRGVVFDSLVFMQGVPMGVANTLFPNSKAAAWTLEKLIQIYLLFAYPFATRHYIETTRFVYRIPIPSPALLLVSETDRMSSVHKVTDMVEVWRRKGLVPSARIKLFPNAPHVQIRALYPKDYEDLVDGFLKEIKLL